jgi:hypothetical protein
MTKIIAFFALDETKQLLSKLNRFLSEIPEKDSDRFLIAKQISSVIGLILNNVDQFDRQCQTNIQWIGSSFISELANLDNSQEPIKLDVFLSTLYRFLIEFDLSMKDRLSFELQSFQRFVNDNLEKFEPRAKEQILFARQEMPVGILKEILNHDEIGNLKNVSAFSTEISQKFEAWEGALSKHEKTVGKFQEALDAQKTAFNFVGLHDGFSDLAKAKTAELKSLRGFMVLFGICVVAPLFAELAFAYTQREYLSTIQPIFLGITSLLSLSLTLLLIYIFRISVRSVDSCKAQLLQLELRKTLCRFIQSYADYSKDIKEKNPESLAKFESLIFSGIVSNEERLPSTFDGIDQLSNFVKALRDK